MDHGPIVAQGQVALPDQSWPCSTLELSDILAQGASTALVDVMNRYENNQIIYIEQNHNQATYTHMIQKADAEVFPETESIEDMYRKYQAYKLWPEAFYMNKDGKRVKIKKMSKDKIERVIVEGKGESDFAGF